MTTFPLTDTPVTVNPLIVKSDVATVEESRFAENVTSIVVSEITSDDVIVIVFTPEILSLKLNDSERAALIA